MRSELFNRLKIIIKDLLKVIKLSLIQLNASRHLLIWINVGHNIAYYKNSLWIKDSARINCLGVTCVAWCAVKGIVLTAKVSVVVLKTKSLLSRYWKAIQYFLFFGLSDVSLVSNWLLLSTLKLNELSKLVAVLKFPIDGAADLQWFTFFQCYKSNPWFSLSYFNVVEL